jgi:formate hydrogenlyase subunit 3/multisubunit Na+/H+ antiporter MnhD subunit
VTALALACVAALLCIAGLSLFAGRSRAVYGGCLAVCLVGLGLGLAQMWAEPVRLALPLGLPWIGANFRLDALSAGFLAVVNLGGAAASLYALGHGGHEPAPMRVLPFFPAFLAAMDLVVLADDAFTFLVAWEFMSLTSWALVMAHHEEPENLRAGYVYLVMASFGTLCLLLAFALLAGPEGSYAFADIDARPHPPALSGLVFVLVLVGAGSKAGLAPLHVWLPLAHPAAPSHVSALMSGVMTKVAVYGFVRIAFDLLGDPEWWWAMAVLAVGGGTAVLGVLQAVMERDLKKLLAYSTVENVGIVFVGLGLALAFRANRLDAAAALALTAAFLHVLNHALFKSLLFLGAGAVLAATGLRDLERLGGLIHRMPGTSLAFLAGAVAISALPPFNGFVSEWLTFQAILLSPQIPQWGLKLMIPAVGALLALAAALAGACFVRAFGLTFLGRPRDAAAKTAHETDRLSLSAMGVLAVLCLLAGILPGPIMDFLAPAVGQLAGARVPPQGELPWLTVVPVAQGRSSYNGLLVFLFIAASAWATAFAIHRLASRRLRRSDPWDCGFPDPAPVMQYGPSSFAQPIRRVFANVGFTARETVAMPPPGSPQPARFAIEVRDLVWEAAYMPLARGVDLAAGLLNHLQFLTIRRYLALVFAALVSLLLALAIWA